MLLANTPSGGSGTQVTVFTASCTDILELQPIIRYETKRIRDQAGCEYIVSVERRPYLEKDGAEGSRGRSSATYAMPLRIVSLGALTGVNCPWVPIKSKLQLRYSAPKIPNGAQTEHLVAWRVPVLADRLKISQ
ncbi:hypothetical protein CROQUDRAFT_132496 [Cronartium quercuum f. sp. fusiforme G11]|uniref:Uncharacterized protein n=1 Tax=Cronartium quercuum f. sp. fusiforme G11 TaxID=708437 RepID=A0A9P6TE73_9BASI|nr:hypothetical protein CROQUDRAFT_132496 [Cronartium quercuum f. sp. fusiforme G11]